MKTEILNELIDEKMKKRGCNEYTVESMKLVDADHYINDKGELKHEQHILVKATGFKLNEEKNVVYRFKINLHTINENNGSI